jgi:hypothetical protein
LPAAAAALQPSQETQAARRSSPAAQRFTRSGSRISGRDRTFTICYHKTELQIFMVFSSVLAKLRFCVHDICMRDNENIMGILNKILCLEMQSGSLKNVTIEKRE